MPGLSRRPAHAEERRQRYYQLRREGADMWVAAAEVGVTEHNSVKRYERWFQAAERGEIILCGGDFDAREKRPQAPDSAAEED